MHVLLITGNGNLGGLIKELGDAVKESGVIGETSQFYRHGLPFYTSKISSNFNFFDF